MRLERGGGGRGILLRAGQRREIREAEPSGMGKRSD